MLVDELAHTNVPGTRHEKRWQSVEEILAAGINVISTVNVQHFESLNDTVFEITGVRVQETLPDAVLDEADEVVLVDLTTDALLNRLKRGVVYDLDKIPARWPTSSSASNLVALRELALRKTAEEVDDSLERIIAGDEVVHPWATEERILVCVRPSPVAAKLIRRGHRLAKRFQGRFWVVHVRTPGPARRVRPAAGRELFELAQGARRRGRGAEAPTPLATRSSASRARSRATFIVMGQSRRSRVDEIVRGSLIARIIREIDHVDVLVVADPSKAPAGPDGGVRAAARRREDRSLSRADDRLYGVFMAQHADA